MQIIARNGAAAPYNVTSDDVLWLLRAVEQEGRVQRDVAAVLVNGFAWNRSQGSRKTLAQWVRAYAQPVNPDWFERGDLFKQRYAKATSDDERRELLADARARERVHSKRTTFTPATHAAVRDALHGLVELKHWSAVDYAAPRVASTRIPLEPVPTTNRNRLYTRRGAETWAGYAARPTVERSKAPAVAAVCLGAAAVAVGVYATRKKGGRA